MSRAPKTPLPLLRTNEDQQGQREGVRRADLHPRTGPDQIPALAVRDAQPEAIPDSGTPDMSKLARPAGITQRTLVANGDTDILVPTVNSYLLAGHIPHAELLIYPDAGHGFLSQYRRDWRVGVM